jgi:hypothetical protein
VAAPAAQAGGVPATDAGCGAQPFSPVFAAWGDLALYTPVPGGDFEPLAQAWTLSGGASEVQGSSPFGTGARSLSLPPDATALSPPICVEKNYPSWRFAAQSAGGMLAIEVLYPAGLKDSRVVMPAPAWMLSPVVTLATGLFGTGPADIRLRLTASRGTVRVDDVYVDPRLRR